MGQTYSVDKMAMIVKIQPDFKQDHQAELYVLMVGTNMSRPIILQPWNEFRIFRSQKYTDCFFRHLHCQRDDNFLLKTQYFI